MQRFRIIARPGEPFTVEEDPPPWSEWPDSKKRSAIGQAIGFGFMLLMFLPYFVVWGIVRAIKDPTSCQRVWRAFFSKQE